MLRSMTGFATKTVEIPVSPDHKASLTLTLKSLNARYFEASCRLPYSFQSLEVQLVKLFKHMLIRGKINFNLTTHDAALLHATVQPASTLIESYISAIGTIQKKYHLSGEFTLSDLVTLPHTFHEQEVTIAAEAQDAVLEAAQELCHLLVATQLEEGSLLAHDIEKRCTLIQQEMSTIEKRSVIVFEKNKELVDKKLTELPAQALDVAELKKTYLYHDLERSDIHEEIVRFKSHIIALTATLQSADREKGRRIDFILQELMREINTITSKCVDATISSHAINVKVELEKIREQIQNIV